MDKFGIALAYFLAIAFIFLAYRFVHKEKYALAVLSLFLTTGAFFVGQPWFQGFIKTQIISTTYTTLQEYGKKLDSFQKEIVRMSSELAIQQTNIANQYKDIKILQNQLVSAQTNLLVQQTRIQDVEFLVKNLYSKMVFEDILASDTNRVAIQVLTNGVFRLAVRLQAIPVPNSFQGSIEDRR